jgi:putative flippase GtrA
MIRKITRYAIVGILGTLTHIGILVALVEAFHQEPVFSSTVGFMVALVISYFLNRNWTFQTNLGHSYALTRYVIVSFLGLLLNSGIMYLTVNILGWWYLFGQLTVILLVPASNFWLNSSWSFRTIERAAG